jgi:hypothetical protein
MVNPKVINYFIKNSPVGEVHEVLGDVVKIVGIQSVQHDKVREAIRKHLEEHKTHVKLPDGRMAMINTSERQADIEGGHFCYFDRKLNTKFTFDPFDMSPAQIKVC